MNLPVARCPLTLPSPPVGGEGGRRPGEGVVQAFNARIGSGKSLPVEGRGNSYRHSPSIERLVINRNLKGT
jgi:hypothetical protein